MVFLFLDWDLEIGQQVEKTVTKTACMGTGATGKLQK